MTGRNIHAVACQMPNKAAAIKLNSDVSYTSYIDEAGDLIRRCAEPRPAGDKVKSAIIRASRRLGLPFSRTKDIWYRDARRIDAREMDRLRLVADQTELANAVGCVDLVRKKMLLSPSASDRELAAALGAALRALGADANGGRPDE